MEIAIDIGHNDSELVMIETAFDKLVEVVGLSEIHELDVDGVIEVAEHVDIVEPELHGLVMAEFVRSVWNA